jgi:hypothetical protein
VGFTRKTKISPSELTAWEGRLHQNCTNRTKKGQECSSQDSKSRLFGHKVRKSGRQEIKAVAKRRAPKKEASREGKVAGTRGGIEGEEL